MSIPSKNLRQLSQSDDPRDIQKLFDFSRGKPLHVGTYDIFLNLDFEKVLRANRIHEHEAMLLSMLNHSHKQTNEHVSAHRAVVFETRQKHLEMWELLTRRLEEFRSFMAHHNLASSQQQALSTRGSNAGDVYSRIQFFLEDERHRLNLSHYKHILAYDVEEMRQIPNCLNAYYQLLQKMKEHSNFQMHTLQGRPGQPMETVRNHQTYVPLIEQKQHLVTSNTFIRIQDEAFRQILARTPDTIEPDLHAPSYARPLADLWLPRSGPVPAHAQPQGHMSPTQFEPSWVPAHGFSSPPQGHMSPIQFEVPHYPSRSPSPWMN